MQTRLAMRYSLFLVLLILGQEFSVARYSDAPVGHDPPFRGQEFSFPDTEDILHEDGGKEDVYSAVANLAPMPGDLDSDYSDLTDEDFNVFDEEEQKEPAVHEDNDGNNPHNKKEDETVEKRGIFTIILLSVTLGAQIADVGTEVYFKIAGCCHAYRDACRYKNIFRRQQTRMKSLNKKIDARVLMAKNLLTDINLTNGQIGLIMSKVSHIMSLEENLITKLDPKIIQQFKDMWKKIEAALVAKNSTVSHWAYKDLSISFNSAFDNVRKTIFVVGGLASWFVQPLVMRAYTTVKRNYLDRQLTKSGFSSPNSPTYQQLSHARTTKSGKVLGVDRVGINKAMQDARTAKLNGAMHTIPGKWSRRLATSIKYASVAIALASIAYSIYKVVKRFEQCSKIAKNAKDGAMKILEANAMMEELLRNVTSYDNYLSRVGAEYIRGQLTKPSFLKTLGNIKTLLINSGRRSLNNRRAAAGIEQYLIKIKQAPFTKTYDMARTLIANLGRVEYLYKCLINKVKISNYVIDNCKRGNYPLNVLFIKAKKSWNTAEKACVDKSGIPYFTLAGATQTVTKAFNGTFYSLDCLINSDSKMREICRLVRVDGDTLTQAASTVGITRPQAAAMFSRCPPLQMEAKDKTLLCFLRNNYKMTDQRIKSVPAFKYFTLAAIKAYKCPKKSGK